MRFRLLLIFLFIGANTTAQTQEDTFIKDLLESIAENLPEDYDLSELQDRLTFFRKHPINLNNTNTEELKSLVFLSPLQIASLFKHIQFNGKLIDVLELQSITDFNQETVQRLMPFVTLSTSDLIDPLSVANLIKLGESDLLLRYGRVLQQPKGYKALPGSRYSGEQDRLLWRYKFNYSNRFSASLILEKDAGEELLTSTRPIPMDYQSAHIAIYQTGRFKKVILGDYSLQFAQGLTLWTGFSFGKAPDVASVAKRDVGLRAYTSSNEYSFLRGLATTLSLTKEIDFTSFVSFRKLDASLSINNQFEDVLTTINETGLHRTATEVNNKNSIGQKVVGGIIQYQKQQFSLGAIAYHTWFDTSFITGAEPYRNYHFMGKELTNLGIHYNYNFKNIYFFGEFGKSLNSGIAYINGALISLSSKLSVAILQRNYQRNYHNFFNQATAEGSDAFNEKGFYLGLNINPAKAWNLALYADYFKFPWLKFRIDAPSDGHEVLAQLTFTPTKTLKALLRYKSELKQQNTEQDVPINYLDHVKKEMYRGDVSWKLNKALSFQHRLEVVHYQKGDARAEFAYLVYQDVAYAPMLAKLSGNIRLAYFNTPSFNSRIYAYEDDVLYNFSFSMYNGKGLRTYANLKYKMAKNLDVWAKYALFLYRNTETVGSGLDEIEGNQKAEMRLQIRYQF